MTQLFNIIAATSNSYFALLYLFHVQVGRISYHAQYRHHQARIIENTRFGTLIVATIYLQLIQNRYMFRSFTVLQFSYQHCVQPVASDVEVVGYL